MQLRGATPWAAAPQPTPAPQHMEPTAEAAPLPHTSAGAGPMAGAVPLGWEDAAGSACGAGCACGMGRGHRAGCVCRIDEDRAELYPWGTLCPWGRRGQSRLYPGTRKTLSIRQCRTEKAVPMGQKGLDGAWGHVGLSPPH